MTDTSSFMSGLSRSPTPTTSLPVTTSPSASPPPSISTSLPATVPLSVTSQRTSSEILSTPSHSPTNSTAPGSFRFILPDSSDDQQAGNKIWNNILRSGLDLRSISKVAETCRALQRFVEGFQPTTYYLPLKGRMSMSLLKLAEKWGPNVKNVVIDLRETERSFISSWKSKTEQYSDLEVEQPHCNLFVPSTLGKLQNFTIRAGQLAWTTSLFGDRSVRGAIRPSEPQLFPMEYAGLQDDTSRKRYNEHMHGHYTDPTLLLVHEAILQDMRCDTTKDVKIAPYDEALSLFALSGSEIFRHQADLSTLLLPYSKRTLVDMTSLDIGDIKKILAFSTENNYSWLDLLRNGESQLTFIVQDRLKTATIHAWGSQVEWELDQSAGWTKDEEDEVLGRIKIISESDIQMRGSEVADALESHSNPTTSDPAQATVGELSCDSMAPVHTLPTDSLDPSTLDTT